MSDVANGEERRYQFGIRDLFCATIGIAVAAGVAHIVGAGSLPFSCGSLLLLANRRGWFARLQHGASQRLLGLVASGLFAGALFLPSLRGCNGAQDLCGWEVARTVMTHEAHLVYEAAVSPQNRSETLDNPLHFVRLLTFLTGVNVGNLLLATALLAPWRWFKSLTCAYPALAVFGTAAIWLATWRDSTGFLIGWWFWLASSYVLAVLVRPPWYALVPATMLWALMWYK